MDSGCPTGLLQVRTDRALGVQRLRIPRESRAVRAQVEDAPHDRRLRLVDPAFDVGALAVRAEHLHVVVAEPARP